MKISCLLAPSKQRFYFISILKMMEPTFLATFLISLTIL